MENSLHKQALEAYKSMISIAARNKAGEIQFASPIQGAAFYISYGDLKEMLDYVATGEEDVVRKIYTKTIVERVNYWKEKVAS
jgi:hypothetical protein